MSNITEQDERDFKNHKAEFDRICTQYNLRGEEKAGELANYISGAEGGVNPEEFATKFGIAPVDAVIFLSWINVGLRYKEMHLNDKDKQTLEQLGLKGL